MTAKIRRENSRMMYQRIQRENDVVETETRNTRRWGDVEDYKRETKCKRIKDMHRGGNARAALNVYTRLFDF